MSSETRRHYVFTVFPQHESDAESLCEQTYQSLSQSKYVRYAIFQLERGESTGRLHVQGYVEFKRPTRRSAAKLAIGNVTANVQERRGTRIQARDYASKEETRVSGPWSVHRLSFHILHLADY